MDAPDYSAREYIGCISNDDVQRALLRRSEGKFQKLENLLFLYPEVEQAWRHSKPGCICRQLHDECYLGNGAGWADGDLFAEVGSQGRQKPDLLDGVTIQQVQDAGKGGCWFCAVICKGVESALASIRTIGLPGNIHDQLHVSARKPSSHDVGRPLLRVALIFPPETGRDSLRYEFYTQEGLDHSHICACLRTAPEIPLSTALPESFVFSKRQLAKCIKGAAESHAHCEAGEVELPTRVLEITELDGKYRVHLLVTNGLKGKYVALSHCWGLKMHATTTSANVGERQAGISWDCLSRSFRDAIHITHRLGFRYLWIDALCILQGDSVDWQYESGRMHLVYHNCALMISADKARDGGVGCFSNIAGSSWLVQCSPYDVNIAVRPAKSHSGVLGPNWAQYSSMLGPLAERAWAFQERTLARRILHYTADELVWECGGMYACQCGDIENVFNFGRNAVKFLFQNCDLQHLVDHVWLGLTADYSARLLAFPEDRLPAFSGLAKKFEFTWKELIEQRRARHASGDEDVKVQPPLGSSRADLQPVETGSAFVSLPKDLAAMSRPTKYIAPSWSWASINSRIQYTAGREKLCNISIETVVCTLSGTDQTGAVKAGHLLLSGPVVTLNLSCKNPTSQSGIKTSNGYYTLRDYAQRDVSESYVPDYLLTVDEIHDTGDASLTVYGLVMSPDFVMVLKRVQKQDVYARIGSLTFGLGDLKDQPTEWSQDALEMALMIV